ncbi:hypothetical protein BST61_g5326 [Cercospora zeina]
MKSIPHNLARLTWLAEDAHYFVHARMMHRKTEGMSTGIAVAYLHGVSIDLYLHDDSRAKAAEFYRLLPPNVVLRHATLADGEGLTDVGICRSRRWTQCSTARIRFATSMCRLIDLGPLLPTAFRQVESVTSSMLEAPRHIRSIWVNTRHNISEPMVLCMDSSPSESKAQYATIRNLPTTSHRDEPPESLRTPFCPLFRDSLTLSEAVDVWEEKSEEGVMICKGMHSTTQILGQWRTGLGARVRRVELGEAYAVGSSLKSGQQVCIVGPHDRLRIGNSAMLDLGKTIIWWMNNGENVVRIEG